MQGKAEAHRMPYHSADSLTADRTGQLNSGRYRRLAGVAHGARAGHRFGKVRGTTHRRPVLLIGQATVTLCIVPNYC